VSRHFDAIIIGTGQAGPSLAARFAAAGMEVAIIERDKFGGTCVNTGCIPTKTLVASAYAAHVARRGAEYGFVVNGDVRVDMKRVKARKDEVAGRSNKRVEEWLRGLKNWRVIQGHARFQSSRTVEVNDEVLEADKLFINVGGRASVPAIQGIHDVPFLTNSSMMDVDFLPEHLVIVGGSYVALEFAQSLTINCKRTCPASGPWVTATAAAPSRTLRTTTTRSSPIISSTQAIAACQTESRRTLCLLIRR